MLFRLEVLGRGAADGALVGRLDALELLTTDRADHRDVQRRVWGLAVRGLYLLAGIAREVGDGDLAGYNVLHGVARPCERVFDEREVYVRGAPLARQLLSHVARDIAHEALRSAVEALDGVLGPGELTAAALWDDAAGPLEGGVVNGALAARGPLDLLL